MQNTEGLVVPAFISNFHGAYLPKKSHMKCSYRMQENGCQSTKPRERTWHILHKELRFVTKLRTSWFGGRASHYFKSCTTEALKSGEKKPPRDSVDLVLTSF